MPDIYKASAKDKIKPARPRHKLRMQAGRQETVVERLDKQRTNGSVKAYLVRPRTAKFETQEKKEKIILLLRRHLLTELWPLVIVILMVLAPIILKFVPLLSFLPGRFRIMTVLMWYLLVSGVIFEKFLTWFFNVNIITDERIIDVDFYSLGYKEVSEAKIDKVQDVSYITGGAIRSLFNYGDVLIQTAGEKPQLIFEAVPNPERVVKILNELVLEEEQEKIEGRTR